jgi:hypothetical protein
MIPAALDCIYSDLQITVHHLRPAQSGDDIYTFSHARSSNCIHPSHPGYQSSRDWHTEAGNFFIIIPNNPSPADEHYMLCPLFQFSHSKCLVGNADGLYYDHNQLIARFPGLLDFFQTPAFVNATINWPMLSLHVPASKKEHCAKLIRQQLINCITTDDIHNWRLQLQLKIPAVWDQDEWQLTYRLSMALHRDLETTLSTLTQSFVDKIDQSNIDFSIERKRIIRQCVINWLPQTMVGRFLLAMQNKQDPRAVVTQHVVITHLVDCLDSALADTIRTVVLEHHKEYTEIV